MLQIANGVKFDRYKSKYIYHDQDVFEANETTLRILEICCEPKSETEIVKILLTEYQVDEKKLVKDISDITTKLLKNGLLVKIQ